MAALLLASGEHLTTSRLQDLYQQCEKLLPSYARPKFLRIRDEMEVTSGTMKQRKVELVEEGFNPAKTQADPLYCVDVTGRTYSRLGDTVYHQVVSGEIRL